MLSSIYVWLGGLFAVIAAAVGLYIKGRRDSTAKSDAEKLRGEIKVEKHTNEVLQKAKDASDDVSVASDSDVQQRLRDKWSRD